MKKIFITIVALTFSTTNIIFCADNHGKLLEKAAINQKPLLPINIIDGLELDWHTPAHDLAHNIGLNNAALYGTGASVAMAGAISLLSESSTRLTGSASAAIGLCVGAYSYYNSYSTSYTTKEESLKTIQKKLNEIIVQQNKITIVLNNLSKQEQEMVELYSQGSPIDENPTHRKQVYQSILTRNGKKSHNELHVLLHKQLLDDHDSLLRIWASINNSPYCGYRAAQGPDRWGKLYGKINQYQHQIESLDDSNKQKIRDLKIAIESSNVHSQYALLKVARKNLKAEDCDLPGNSWYNDTKHSYSVKGNPSKFETLEDDRPSEVKKMKYYHEMECAKKEIKTAESEIFDGDLSSIYHEHHTCWSCHRATCTKPNSIFSSYGNYYISRYNRSLDKYNQLPHDQQFNDYFPESSPIPYTVPSSIINYLLPAQLSLNPYLIIKSNGDPNESVHELENYKKEYEQDINKIAHWLKLVPYCDEGEITKVSNNLFSVKSSSKEELKDALKKHKEILKDLCVKLEAYKQVIHDQSDSEEIERTLKPLHTPPDGWQCKNMNNVKRAI